MIAQQTVIKQGPRQDHMNNLQSFLSNVQKLEQCNLIEQTKISLNLLRTLPATRYAVFEYFNNTFTLLSSRYVVGIENEIKTGEIPVTSETDEMVVSEIHSVLVSLINEIPTSWAPIISTWSLELLGEISSKFAGRAHISTGVLNETLQLWMGCRATRTLVDINTKCLSSLMYSDTESCINALLDTSVKHSPNFDWVVAHVGSCFPNTVITRVLSCGLKDFCKNKSHEQGKDSAKIKSVVGILGHLAGSHAKDIREAILEIFKWSLEPCSGNDLTKVQKKLTVPFILQLCYMSSTLLSSVCNDFSEIFSIEVVERFHRFVEDWCRYFGSEESLQEIIITLILRCDTGGIRIIKLLLECISTESWSFENETSNAIKEKCREILHTVIVEIDASIRFKNPVNIMESLQHDVDEINELLLSERKIESILASRLVIFLGSSNPCILIKSLLFLLQNSKSDDHVSLIIKIATHELIDKTKSPHCEKGGYLAVALQQVLSKDIQKFSICNEETTDFSQIWHNLLTMLKWEKSGKVPILKCHMVSKAIYANLETITSVFGHDIHHMHVIAELLDELEIPTANVPLTTDTLIILNLTESTVDYFFACCSSDDSASKTRGFKRVCSIIRRLCTFSNIAKVLALRTLLERALFRSDNILFGAVYSQKYTNENTEKLLLKQNKKISKTIPLTKHSSVFNGGIIGGGKRKFIHYNKLPSDTISTNISSLIGVIKACCSLPDGVDVKFCDLSLESVILVSLLLVQFVSPDVMYNGLPWPEEEFLKVTVERDLLIAQFFKTTPLLWDLLSFVAVYRPALCYCSVLLRALTATLIHQWRSMGDQSKANATHQYEQLLENTTKIIDIMALGQLLPPPLSSVRDVFAHLKSFEIVAILRDCIWFYMRDHVPYPALFRLDNNGIYWRDPSLARPPDIYTNSLRIILQRNVKSLGEVYSKMFINIPKQE